MSRLAPVASHRRRNGRSWGLLAGLSVVLLLVAGLAPTSWAQTPRPRAALTATAPAPADLVRAATATTGAVTENCPHVPGRKWCLSLSSVVDLPAPAVPGSRAAAATVAATAGAPYTPADLVAAYRVPWTNTAATVAIVDAFDAPSVEADMAHYRAQFHLPACTSGTGCFRKVNQWGAASPLPWEDAGWAAETTLDVEMVSAICPSCHILLIEADSDDRYGDPDMETATARANVLRAPFISMSWGGTESSTQTAFDPRLFGRPAVVYVAASGDSDYGTSWPATNAHVVAVGGTTLRRSTAIRGWAESVWGVTTGGRGTGSGCSTVEPKPAWQQFIPSKWCTRRLINDVAVVGDPVPGVMVYRDGVWFRAGGTSVGAPIVAAMYAVTAGATLANPPASYPYGRRALFHDIAAGGNGACGTLLCRGQVGWDGPTGVGSPSGVCGFAAPITTTMTIHHNPGWLTTYVGTAASINVRGSDSRHSPVFYSVTGLPPGTSLRADGVIVGTPRAPSLQRVRVTAHSCTGAAVLSQFTWRVAALP